VNGKLALVACFTFVLGLCGSVAHGQENQIVNGEFDNGLDGWGIYIYLNTQEGFDVEVDPDAGLSGENAALLDIYNAPVLTSIGIGQGGLVFEPGVTYPICFTAKSDVNRGMVVLVQAKVNNTSYLTFLDQTVDLTTSRKKFAFEYTHTGDTIGDDEGEILILYLILKGVLWSPPGANLNGKVWIDRVSIGAEIPRQPIYRATSPTPEDGAIIPDTWVSASWTPGDLATSHDVYMGDDFDQVNEGTGETFRGNQKHTYFIAGFPGFLYPDGLIPGTIYYWRIDEVEADGVTKHTGNVWSFLVPSLKAYNPEPADGRSFVAMDSILSWSPAYNAKLHTVYFGTDFDTVANATGGRPKAMTTYDPGLLEPLTTYYWRVDELTGAVTQQGEVWSFTTTQEGLGSAVMSRWENIATTDLNALKNDPRYPDNPDVVETVTEFQWNIEDLDDYGARIDGWLYPPATGDYTFWMTSDNQGELWLSTDDDSSNVELIAYVKDSPTATSGWTYLNEWTKYASQKSEPIPLIGGEKYYIMSLWKEGDEGDHCQVAWEGPGISERVIIPGTYLSPYEPPKAYGPIPSNKASGVTQMPTLQWKSGLEVVSHDVYFGTDESAVANATHASPEFKANIALGNESYDPGQLEWNTTYYWRVDEINNAHPDSPWIGRVWSFTTADYLIVDDFEDYTDDDTTGKAIWQSWIDGFDIADNGAQAGYLFPPYAEQTTVHSGSQSMPLLYANTVNVTNSEVVLTLTWPRDWTEEGVADLSLWFRGLPESVGSFTEDPVGTYMMTGSGTDIWGNADEFHYAYKTLTGAGSIVARVNSVQNTNAWAKAGVMIRETLDGGSKHAFACITPISGIASQGRLTTGGDSFNYSEAGITAPIWVKVERDVTGNFSVQHSANGTSWQPVTGAIPQSILMTSTVFIGLALTSHDATLPCEAVFSNVTTTGTVSGQWTNQDIGIVSNDAEPLYVAISNAGAVPVVAAHEDPRAATIDTWTEWIVPLKVFSDQGVKLTDVDKIAMGLGTKGSAKAAGGSGTIYIDDIRLKK